MPYIFVSAKAMGFDSAGKVHLIGRSSDSEFFESLGAQQSNGNSEHYKLHENPIDVLNLLENYGYYVVGSACLGENAYHQNIVWTLKKL